MTEHEALGIISVLTASLFGLKKLKEEVNGKGGKNEKTRFFNVKNRYSNYKK
jgi:prephenate dehydratase